jgi:hypothetical protein
MRVLVLALVVIAVGGIAGSPQGFFRSIGVRAVLPWTGVPFLVGVEATTNLAFGLGTASLLLTTEGRGLFTIGADIRLSQPDSREVTYLRLVTGVSYFDLLAYGPSFVLGAGMAFEVHVLEPITFGVAAEFVYPFALPIPVFSTSVGWLLQ